jgi:hypothetical protein
MSLDISGVRFERLRWIGRLVYRRQGLLLEWGSFVAFLCLTSPEMGPVFEISGTEKHQRGRETKRTFALFVHEVEPIRKAVILLISCVRAKLFQRNALGSGRDVLFRPTAKAQRISAPEPDMNPEAVPGHYFSLFIL